MPCDHIQSQRVSGAVDNVMRHLHVTLKGSWEKAGNMDVILCSTHFSLIRTKQEYFSLANNPYPTHWRMEQYESVHPLNSELFLCLVYNLDHIVSQEAMDADLTLLMRANKMSVLADLEVAYAVSSTPHPCNLICVNSMIQPDKGNNSTSFEDSTNHLDSLVEDIDQELAEHMILGKEGAFKCYKIFMCGRQLTLRIKRPMADMQGKASTSGHKAGGKEPLLQMDDDDEIFNLVDLHICMLCGGWKWHDLQGLLCKAYIVLDKETMRIEESLNATFDESLPEPKSSSSVEYDRINEPIVQDLNGSPSLQVNVSYEGYPKSVKEARGHPIEQLIGELNERTLRSKTKQALVFRMTISKGQMA
ncbi:hypothetical protein Tco_0853684 [Tanacetum coccineum]